MGKRETNIQNRILLELSEAGCVVWRNETAGAWVGQVVYRNGNEVTLRNARMLHLGLCKGSSDIIGIQPKIITPEDIGTCLGQFIAPEVKTKNGRVSEQQKKFGRAVNAAGGKHGIVRSVEDALQLIK